jgi:uncharacterized protein YqgC (DUF456 family)
MDILAAAIFIVLYLLGLVGIIVPVLPSTPLIALGAIIYGFMTGFERLSVQGVVWVVVLALLAQLIDYLASVIGAQRFGASKEGIWGGVLGSIAGLVLLPPFGFLPGALLGAMGAELLNGRRLVEAWRSGLGALLGTLGGILVKILIVIAMGVVVFPKLF